MSWHAFDVVVAFVFGIALGIKVTIFAWDLSLKRAESPRDHGGLMWYDYDHNVWTNAAGWYTAAERKEGE